MIFRRLSDGAAEFIEKVKNPDGLCRAFWLAVNRIIMEESFFISLMILFNFAPYLYLFCLYSQYMNAAGGFFKPLADIVLAAAAVNYAPRGIRSPLRCAVLLINGALSLMELFIVGKYYTFATAGIVSVILGTNLREAAEFAVMYFSWEYIFVLAVLAALVYAAKAVGRRTRAAKMNAFFALITPFFFLYSIFYTLIPGRNITECMTFTRLIAPVSQAAEDFIAFRSVYASMQSDVKITENKSEIPNVVFILGESTSRQHMSLYGYRLPTTPKLDELKEKGELCVFSDVISPHAYTIGSLKEAFTFHNYEMEEDGVKWYETNNLFDVVKKAGYKTYWLSNQETSGQWANVALAYADRCDFKAFTGVRQSYEQSYRADGEILPLLYEAMNSGSTKNFYILHLMGTHGEYKNRYTPDFDKFKPKDETKETAQENELRAQYDNAVLYNDTIVAQIIAAFKDKNAIVIYMPDHGEEIYDVKHMKGHSDDNPTRSMLEIPFIIYASPQFKAKYPQLNRRIEQAADRPFMTDDLIHFMLDIMGIKTEEYQETRSLISPYYNQGRKRMFLGKDYDLEMKNK